MGGESVRCAGLLNDLPDDLAAKIAIHDYLDARDALLKALAV